MGREGAGKGERRERKGGRKASDLQTSRPPALVRTQKIAAFIFYKGKNNRTKCKGLLEFTFIEKQSHFFEMKTYMCSTLKK